MSLSLVGKISWRSKWQPTPISLPRESRGQRSLAGYGPWDLRVRNYQNDLACIHRHQAKHHPQDILVEVKDIIKKYLASGVNPSEALE